MSENGPVRLRRVEPEDYPHIQRWQNDPEVARWMDYDRLFSLQDIRESEERANQEGHPFIIEVEGRPIGRVGLNNIRPRDGMASAYIFVGDRNVWGHGYGLHAMFALLRFGFDSLNLRRIELWQLEGNDRAYQMYKSCGFEEEARLPDRSFMAGAYVGHIVMSVDRDGFERALESHVDK